LLLRVGLLASLAARHETVGARLCVEPRWTSLFVQQGTELPAHQVLHVHQVLDNEIWKGVLEETEGQRYYWPGSHLSRDELRPIAESLVGSTNIDRELSRMEFRLALASQLLRPNSESAYDPPAAGGDFLLYDRYRQGREDRLPLTDDFLVNGESAGWIASAIPSVDDMESVIVKLDERLRMLRDRAD
jgi:hypothetical protein